MCEPAPPAKLRAPVASSTNELLIAVLGFAALLVLILARLPIAAVRAIVGVRTTAMVFFIVIGADLFGYFMALSQMPMRFAAWLSGLQVAPVAILWAIIATYILLGALMDELAMILLTVVTAVGYDPVARRGPAAPQWHAVGPLPSDRSSPSHQVLNQATDAWHTARVTLSGAQGLVCRREASLCSA